MKPHIGVKGHFKLYKGTDESNKELVADFDNLVLDSGLDYFGTGKSPFSYCHVGTGNSTPAISQVGLDAFHHASDTFPPTTGSSDYSLDTGAHTITYTAYRRFSAGSFDGTTISEIGMGYSSTSNYATYPLFSRALILDGVGSPTTITLQDTEYLDVAYTLTYYFDATDKISTFSDGTDTYNYTLRLANFANWSPSSFSAIELHVVQASILNGAVLGTTLADPTYTDADGMSSAAGSYVDGTFQVTGITAFSGTDRSIANDLVDGLYFYVGTGNELKFQVSISPAIPKYDTSDATPNELTFNFSISWGRV